MRALSLALVVALAAPLHADPAQACAVRVVRAPAEIRAEIERWLDGESSCNVPLEVRVVATEGGYYLLARDLHGRVRERIVPDGASAGVLVASWASDDQLGANEPVPNVPRPAGLDDDDDDAKVAADTPIVAPAASPVIAATTVVTPPQPPSKWLRFDALDTVSGTGGTGLRGEIDLWQRDGWAFGVAAAFAYSHPTTTYTFEITEGMTDFSDLDFDGLAYVAKTVDVRTGLHLRGAIAAGARVTRATVSGFELDALDNPVPLGTTMVRATAQASLLAAAELGYGWALDLGVLVTGATASHGEIVPMHEPVNTLDLDAAIGMQLFVGLARRL